ncbi:uncharacterized protein LOC108023981 isoform X2 [Drosophila biarmipes]|uniref:uncharacterized protein LOC108023981 isoform X2 n=1 Tax=Drosophila biarmipes TaxID=125945 RepID=UPI001CDAEE65|nr:uncharacterized protein LOC108023981 isoform X2 [Drosophila biarmipes]
MRFLITIVRMLEQRPGMYLHEIKKSLNIGLATTFEFGFPNLYSMIAAYKDLFTVIKGQTQERANISLTFDCELRKRSEINHHSMLRSTTITYPKRSFHAYCRDHKSTQPPTKAQEMAKKYTNNFKPVCNLKFQGPQDNIVSDKSIISPPAYCFPPRTNISFLNSYEPALEDGSICYIDCNKENSINSSLQLFSSSLNSSNELNTSLGLEDVNNITAITAIPADTSYKQSCKLWRRRQTSFFQLNSTKLPSLDGSTDGSYNMGSIYEPPKPDTPRTEKIPFWIDPVWNERSEYVKPNIFNIRLPGLKTYNVFPKSLSPYTISKNENLKRQLFNFDNHDRKIA